MKTTIQLTISALAMTLLLGACREEKKEAVKSDNSITVKVISSAAMSQAQPVETSGLLGSSEEARLSFKTGGLIKSVLVEEGDRVRKGQLLATLNTTEIAAQVALAEENVLKASRDAKRVENLYRDSVATKEQLENVQTALVLTKKQLEIAQFNLSESRIISPTDGVVLKKIQQAGEQVSGGNPVLYVSSTSGKSWVIKCGLTDRDWTRLQGGEQAEIHFDAFPETISGRVKTMSRGSEMASGLYQVEIGLDKQPARLANGLFAKVSIFPREKQEFYSLPVDALIEGDNDSAFVFLAKDNKAYRQSVKVAYLSGDRAMIRSGIDAGSKVIREGSAYLTNGSEIKVVN